MKEFFKKFKVDIILVSVLLVAAIITVTCFSLLGKADNHIANIYVSNELVQRIDLSNEDEDVRYLTVEGKHGEVKIAIKHNDIKIVESTCPNKDCIHQGSATTLRPVICAYNEVVIKLEGKADVDVEVG